MTHNKQKAAINLKKACTLLTKVLKMIEEDKYCIDIIQQNLAVVGLLKSANIQLLEGHMNSCVKNAINQKNIKKIDEMMTELVKILKLAQNK